MPDLNKPFLKWPGGKRWLVPYVLPLLENRSFTRYIEPFLGGGAMFFGVLPPHAILSDINPELINTYLQVKNNPDSLVERLQRLPVDRSTYSTIRANKSADPIESAVRFLYLNRTSFGGMYRLNRSGEFNVPFGGGQRSPSLLWEQGLLLTASTALLGTTLLVGDFANSLESAGAADVVYCDPTYTVAHNNNGFVRYNERNFSWEDQQRLATLCLDASRRGAYVLVSNAAHEDILHLYPTSHVLYVERWSGLSPKPAYRRRTKEVLLVLDPCAGTVCDR